MKAIGRYIIISEIKEDIKKYPINLFKIILEKNEELFYNIINTITNNVSFNAFNFASFSLAIASNFLFIYAKII